MQQPQLYIRKVAAELLAQALVDLFPKTQIVFSDATEMGFICEFELSVNLDDQALKLIEERMQRTIQEQVEIESVEMMRENAATLFKHRGQHSLAEQMFSHPDNIVELLRIGGFYGICPGPYPSHTKEIGVIRLLKYQQDGSCIIEGVAFSDRKKLKAFTKQYKEYHRYDHVLLGNELDLYWVDKGECVWLPSGEKVRQRLLSWWRQAHRQLGYECFHTNSPQDTLLNFLRKRVPKTLKSSHIEERTVDKRILADRGLFQLRVETQDCSLALCEKEKSLEVLISYLQFIKKAAKMISIDCKWIRFSQNPKGNCNQKKWDLRVSLLDQALNACEIEVETVSEMPVKAPGIELLYVDSLGREWPGPKVELFDSKELSFSHHLYPYVVKSSFFRSLESVVALLVEANAGCLPVWLAPEQVCVLPVTEAEVPYAKQVVEQLHLNDIKVQYDFQATPFSQRVRAAKMNKYPYLLIVGKKEMENGTVAVSSSRNLEKVEEVDLDTFLEKLKGEVREFSFPLI